jgi:hypothetical protein
MMFKHSRFKTDHTANDVTLSRYFIMDHSSTASDLNFLMSPHSRPCKTLYLLDSADQNPLFKLFFENQLKATAITIIALSRALYDKYIHHVPAFVTLHIVNKDSDLLFKTPSQITQALFDDISEHSVSRQYDEDEVGIEHEYDSGDESAELCNSQHNSSLDDYEDEYYIFQQSRLTPDSQETIQRCNAPGPRQ